MQATGQALGLTDEIDATKLTSTNTNLDIHMQKNTEYGAMVLLSASAYGKPDKVNSGETTTGNKTGVVMNINKEWVAAAPNNTSATSVKNAVGRYKDVYPSSVMGAEGNRVYIATYKEKTGDAIATVGGWYGASGNSWLKSYNFAGSSEIQHSCLLRSYNGSIFSYYGYGAGYDGTYAKDENAKYTKTWHSRAVVVVGTGI